MKVRSVLRYCAIFGTTIAFAQGTFADENEIKAESEPVQEEPAQESDPVEWRKERLERLKDIPQLNADDVVSVYYLEHVLASWVLQAAPWNAYHSGLGFAIDDKDGNEKAEVLFEYAPRMTGQVEHQLVPKMEPIAPEWTKDYPYLSDLYAFAAGTYDYKWKNEGGVFFYDHWPKKYTNATFVGKTTGDTFNKFSEWIREYAVESKTFEPVEIVVNENDNLGMDSLMCHDLFSNGIHELHRLGLQPNPQNHIFRDHIVLYATKYSKIDMDSWIQRRQVARYYRLFSSFMDSINEEFTSIRGMLVNANLLGVETVIYKSGEYYRVSMEAPFVNYCYMAVSMPPAKSKLWKNEKLCALGHEVHANQTLTFLSELRPSHALFLADHLVDDPRSWLATAAIGLVTLVMLRKR